MNLVYIKFVNLLNLLNFKGCAVRLLLITRIKLQRYDFEHKFNI